MKKASNIRSDLKKIRGAVQELLELPDLVRINLQHRRKPIKGRWSKGFLKAKWPVQLKAEMAQMRAACTDTNYSGPGYRYLNTVVMRPASFGNIETRLNRVIDFMLNSEGLSEPQLIDFIDMDRAVRFRSWYFEGRTGGFTAFSQICSALSKVARYLEVTGQLKSGFEVGSRHPDAPWRQLLMLGVTKEKEGRTQLKHETLEQLALPKPAELAALAVRCQTQLPRTMDGRAPSTRQIFRWRFAALFFGLGIYAPLRGLNWRNMRWGKNLKREGASWRVHFTGPELKNGTHKGKLRTYSLLLPKKGAAWIEWWREYLRVFVGEDFEQITPYVFPMLSTLKEDDQNFQWVAMSHKYLLTSVDEAARDNLGQGFRPHMIRHCVATHIIATGLMADVQQAATLLGDSVKTVMEMYFKPNEQELLNSGYYAELASH